MRKIEDLAATAPPPGLFPRGIKTSAIDGLRIEYEDGFGLVRASNTTPCKVLRFEGDSEDAMRANSIRVPRRAGRRRFAARDAVLAVPPRASVRPPTIDDAGEYEAARAAPCPHLIRARPPPSCRWW